MAKTTNVAETTQNEEQEEVNLITEVDKKDKPIRRQQIGNLRVLMWRNGEPFFVLGPDWAFSICLYTMVIIFGGMFTIYTYNHDGVVLFGLSLTLWLGLLLSFSMTVFMNPGIQLKDRPMPKDVELGAKLRSCHTCGIIPEKGTVHCADCDVCIKDYDHHCPWTSKCVGGGNLTWFYAFLAFLAGYLIFMIFGSAILSVNTKKRRRG